MWLYKNKGKLLFSFLLIILVGVQACNKIDLDSGYAFSAKLSDYQIFTGTPSELTFTSDFHLYELATELFSDYAEKQRLIKVPAGTQLKMVGDSLPEFPNGSIIVKTFFYYKDKRDPSKGKNILETRLLIKDSNVWHMATYLWNETQTDATLLQSGYNKDVNWIDAAGKGRSLNYHVPNQLECINCHQTDQNRPLGPRLKNMHFDVTRNGQAINQLQYFQNIGLINNFSLNFISTFPAAFDNTFSLEERSRAYMDINCAACHQAAGNASEIPLLLDYNISLDNSNLVNYKDKIVSEMALGDMPSIATSVVDEAGLDLIKQYINSL